MKSKTRNFPNTQRGSLGQNDLSTIDCTAAISYDNSKMLPPTYETSKILPEIVTSTPSVIS